MDVFHVQSERSAEILKIIEGNKVDLYKLLWVYKYSETLQQLPFDVIKLICGLLYCKKDYQVGDLVDALDHVRKWYPCIVMEINQDAIFIHYYGWDIKYDEWINIKSPRLDPLFTHENHYGQLGTEHPAKPCNWCDLMKPKCKDKYYGVYVSK